MDEILWELREHSAGLGCGRWDYVFSYISKFRAHRECLLPDRVHLTMAQPFLASMSELLIATCHRRGAHAIGGLSPYVPLPDCGDGNALCMIRVREDKLREVWAGHDGAWVAHPDLVPHVRDVFDTYMPFPDQLQRRPECSATAVDLLRTPRGTITEEGLTMNLEVGLRYLAAWCGGEGCVTIDHVRENTASAEICRAQLWSWLHHGAALDDGLTVTAELVREAMDRIVEELSSQVDGSRVSLASRLYGEMIETEQFDEFMTARAYECI